MTAVSTSCAPQPPSPAVIEEALNLHPCPTLIVDAEGTVHYANEAAERLRYGLFPSGSLQTLTMWRLRGAIRNHRSLQQDVQIPTKEGLASMVAIVRPFGDADAELVLSLLSLRESDAGGGASVETEQVEPTEDTELESLRRASLARQRALEEAIRDAEAASRAKSLFLTNISHEVRTPMTAIMGYAELLVRDLRTDPDGAAEAVRTIQANGTHLLAIINDLLDVSKLEADQMTVDSIDTSVVQIVEQVASVYRRQAAAKSVELRLEYETTIPAVITSDPTRLRQILVNLVGNAVKFTDEGLVTISVRCDLNAQKLRFCVVDTGIGMSESALAQTRQFKVFRQVDPTMSRRFSGTGMGLRICDGLAKMLGGSIEVASEEGVGSMFTLTVPTGALQDVPMLEAHAGTVEADAARTRQVVAGPTALAGMVILLAEDGPDNQRLIAYLLERAGAKVTVCDNGRIAVETIFGAVTPPDLVLMDMQMPELDGYQATRTLRQSGVSTPVVALTAHAMYGDRERCLAAGCDDYLTKPVARDALIQCCMEWGRR